MTGPAQAAQAFTTGPISAGYELKSVQVQFDSFSGLVPPRTFKILSETSGAPDFFGTTNITVTRQATLQIGTNTFTAPAGAVLQPNTTYYVTSGLATGSSARYGTTASGAEDPGGLDGWSVADRRRARADGGAAWSTGSAEPLRIRINAREAPPADPAANVAVSNTGQSTASGTAGLTSAAQRLAQKFTTGASAIGYDLHGVALDVGSFAGSASDITVEIHSGVGLGPGQGAKIHTLAAPAAIRTGLATFTAPAGATLDAGAAYYVYIRTSGSALNLKTTASDSEDSGGLAGWGIFHERDFYNGSGWSRNTNVLRISVRATEATGISGCPYPRLRRARARGG